MEDLDKGCKRQRRSTLSVANFMDRRVEKFLFFIIADALLIAAAMVIAFLLRFDGQIPFEYQGRILSYAGLSVGITLPIFILRGLYSFTWSFVSFHEMFDVFKGVAISAFLFTISFLLMRDSDSGSFFSGFPRSILFLHFGLVFLFIGTLRAAKRIKSVLLQGRRNGSCHRKKTLIIGADEPADHLVRALLQNAGDCEIIGILDDMPIKQNTYLHGIPVLGFIADIPSISLLYDIQTIVIALPSAKREVIRNVFNLARGVKIKDIRIVPSLSELLSGTVAIQHLRPVKVEDLLGREQAQIDTAEIEQFLKGKDVLITGAAGSIGSELARQISKFSPHSLHLLDCEESNLFDLMQIFQSESPEIDVHAIVMDVRNIEKTQSVIEHIRPQIIFHAAAYKHVPLMEVFPEEAVATNVFGTLSVYRAALKAGVEKVVLISTDKAVRPISVMGQTKKLAEMLTQSFNGAGKTQFVAVRFGNVLGSRGSVVPVFERQLKAGGPLTVTDPGMTRFFMTAPEAVLLVMEAGAIGQGGEIFVLDMGEPVKITDLARELIRLSGFESEKDIGIVFTGKRPGEKISEEVLTAEEGTTATRYQKIYRVRTSFSMNLQEILISLDGLKRSLLNPQELKDELAKLTRSSQAIGTFSSFAALRGQQDYYEKYTPS